MNHQRELRSDLPDSPGRGSTSGGRSTTRRRPVIRALAAVLAGVLVAGLLAVSGIGASPAAALSDGDITTWIGGPGAGTAFGTAFVATELAIAGNTVYIADSNSSVVRAFDRSTGTFSVVAGSVGTGPLVLGPATATTLPAVNGVAVFGGAVYLATSTQILKVSGGMLSLYAGTTSGFAGDGGPASSAKLNGPRGLVFTPDGTLLFSDSGNRRLRKILPNGTISTFAGTGASGNTGDGGPASSATFTNPGDLARDTAGNLFVGDGARVRRIAAGGTISTVAGTGTPGSSGDGGPAVSANILVYDLDVDAGGNLLIATGVYREIRKVTPGGTISTIAGGTAFGHSGDGGPATAAKFLRMVSVVTDPAGGYLIGDSEGPGDGSWLRPVSAAGTVTSIAGTTETMSSGSSTTAPSQTSEVAGIAVDANGTTYFAEPGNSRVRKVTNAGVISNFAGSGRYGSSGDGGQALSAKLWDPTGVAVDTAGNVYISDTQLDTVRKVAVNGIITTVAGTGTEGFSGDGGQATSATLTNPKGLAVDKAGNLYIADSGNNRIRQVAPNGTITTFAGDGSAGFAGDNGPANLAALQQPNGVAVDGLSRLVISDGTNRRVRRVANGIITTLAGTGAEATSGDGGPASVAAIGTPAGVTVAADGSIFVVHSGARVRRIDPAGFITTVAGSSTADRFAGDGGPATSASFNRPIGVAVKRNGDLLVSDSRNMRIRRVPGVAVSSVRFHSASPTRILDSRTANGGFNGPLGAGAGNVKSLKVGGAGGGVVPTTATAVVMNVTATQGTNGSFLTVYPKGGVVPTASNLNFGPGETIPNLVTVKLDPDGWVSFFNAVGSVHVVADVVGYFDDGYPDDGASFVGLTPTRLLDSRGAVGGFNGPVGPGASKDLTVTNVAGIPVLATTVVLNVTVTGGTAGSFVTVWPAGSAKPNASNVNFGAGQTISNLVTAKVGVGGKVSIGNELGSVHVIADVVGYFSGGLPTNQGRFHPLAPTRVLDDRNGTGGYATPWGPGVTRPVVVAGTNGVPANATGVVVNITATNGTAGSFLTVWGDGVPKPTASTVSFAAGQTIPNLTMVKLGANGKVAIANELGSVDVVADVVGYYADF